MKKSIKNSKPLNGLNKPKKGIFLPSDIAYNKNLNSTKKLLLGIILSLDNFNSCYASNEYLANLLNLTPKFCSVLIAKLVENNYLSAVYNNRYEFIDNGKHKKNHKFKNSNYFRNLHVNTDKAKYLKEKKSFIEKKEEHLEFLVYKLKNLTNVIEVNKMLVTNTEIKGVLDEGCKLVNEMFEIALKKFHFPETSNDEEKKEVICKILKKYKELGFKKINTLLDTQFIYNDYILFGKENLLKALEIMSEISFIRENLSVNSIFNKSNIEKALNGTFHDYKNIKADSKNEDNYGDPLEDLDTLLKEEKEGENKWKNVLNVGRNIL